LVKPELNGEGFSFPAVDKMIEDNGWVCPIELKYQDRAYYSILNDRIVMPEKAQFVDGESFAGTLFHEMTHSTGAESRLNRIKPSAFGSEEYAREELVAELGSALVAQRYGISKNVKEESAAYLKSWLNSLKESPDFIKTTLLDVKRASGMIIEQLDKIAQQIDNENSVQQNVTEKSGESKDSRNFYVSVAYLQNADDTQFLDQLQENGDYDRLLQEAKEYDQGDAIDLEHTFQSPIQNRGDDLLDENDYYAVVYNNSVGGTYEIMRKVPEQEVRSMIERYGLPNDASKDVKVVAKNMVAEQFAEMTAKRMPILEMDNGNVLQVQYNKETDHLDVGTVTNIGLAVKHSFEYDHSFSLDSNLQGVHEQLSEMSEYQHEKADIGDVDNDGILDEVTRDEKQVEEEVEKEVYCRRGR
ncbi:MAG: zincin-like metallopeptidase domain-containing protein, partial [Prevotella sp.]|nr:zincin-like metallopeptidase domain-containing protein [Prevotella sp.]